jgi:hypothetical protein
MMAFLKYPILYMSSSVFYCAFLISTVLAQHIQKYEEDMDRPGFDYNMFEIGPNVNAAVVCQRICTLDNNVSLGLRSLSEHMVRTQGAG